MVAFRTAAGRRIDLITINDPRSPTDTPEEFLALLKATADAARATGLLASQATLLASLVRHAGVGAIRIAAHVTAQTSRHGAFQQRLSAVLDGGGAGPGRPRQVHLRAHRRCARRSLARTDQVHGGLADPPERR